MILHYLLNPSEPVSLVKKKKTKSSSLKITTNKKDKYKMLSTVPDVVTEQKFNKY